MVHGGHDFNNAKLKTIQGVSEIRLLILTSGKSRQFTFTITFCKIRKICTRFLVPPFLPNESFCVINYAIGDSK
jgi:hypothetical protein